MRFESTPPLWQLYGRVLASRKPARVPEGQDVPRVEATLVDAAIDPVHLAAYQRVCGAPESAVVPVLYPHILASGLHLALLSSPGFPVKLLGLVHLAHSVDVLAPLTPATRGDLVAWLEGVRLTERGQEFELHTEWRSAGVVVWRETTTFLSRAKAKGLTRPPPPAPIDYASTKPLEVPDGIGRRYGRIAGDLNPIHLTDLSAKLFGFKGAIAHGLWSLARCLAELKAEGPGQLTAQFKLPVFIPARVTLGSTTRDGATEFSVMSARDGKPHLVGRWAPRNAV
ncbi:MAG: hypothetical protein JNG84_03945 [Archangium sp.]|nr:hypothetical protein [Archangium sp.]